ncbi:hypothetical protein [Maioricimonas sp. JC845]|uniref:P-loop ATPase, Sll1717 family n=1 Tax=Maioricimonas sp. JC845 TaxID=3232138 RepID=UPI0034597035
MSNKSGAFVFVKHDSIGANDADMDDHFLRDCFEDTGDVDVLADLNKSKNKCIVVGRTGAGKTALLSELGRRFPDRVIRVRPETLSLNYVSNSNTIQLLTRAGLNLDPFYKLLWRHVLAVTVLQIQFDIANADAQKSLFTRIMEHFESSDVRQRRQHERKRHKRVVEYLSRWGSSFFEAPDVRTQEVTKTFERQIEDEVGDDSTLSAMIGADAASLSANIGQSDAHSETTVESHQEVVRVQKKVQQAVDSILVQQLSGIVDLLDEVLDDPQKPVYLTVDRLDEDWVVDDEVRLRLLKGLLDTAREFVRIRHCKLVVALRLDLMHRLFRKLRSETGFQEDKYKSLRVPLSWNKRQLESLLNKRIERLVRDRYTKQRVTFEDILPARVRPQGTRRVSTIDYMMERTWMRPRDLIEFLNTCIDAAEGTPKITKAMLLESEGRYSLRCLRALAEEWHGDFPLLSHHIKLLLSQKPSRFVLGKITAEDVMNWALECDQSDANPRSRLHEMAVRYCHSDGDSNIEQRIRAQVASVFFRVGVVGLKLVSHQRTLWAGHDVPNISPAEIDDTATVAIHPALWRVLGTVEVDFD